MGARLQHKLREWQQRLASAAKLRSEERGVGAPAAFGSAGVYGSSGRRLSAGLSSPQDDSESLNASQDSQVQAAIEAASSSPAPASSGGASDGAVSATSHLTASTADSLASARSEASSAAAAAAAGSSGAGSPASPRIPAARPQGPGAAACGHPPAATPGKASKIKELGVKAARSPSMERHAAGGSPAGSPPAWLHATKLPALPRSSSGRGSSPPSAARQAGGMRRLPSARAPATLPAAGASPKARPASAGGQPAVARARGAAPAGIPEGDEEAAAAGEDLETRFASKLLDRLNVYSPTKRRGQQPLPY